MSDRSSSREHEEEKCVLKPWRMLKSRDLMVGSTPVSLLLDIEYLCVVFGLVLPLHYILMWLLMICLLCFVADCDSYC